MTPTLFWTLYFFVVGAAIGSFLNVVIYRVPRKESVVSPGSRCPSCGGSIAWYHNIPILSWFFLRGRCAKCDAPFSPRYMLVELLTALLFAACNARFGHGGAGMVYMALCSALVAIAFIDIDHFIIPDTITIPGIGAGFLCAWLFLPVTMWDSLFGFAAGFGLFFVIAVAVPGGMGGGDIKLMGMVGAFLGLKGALITIFLGSCIGAVVGVAGILFFGKGRKSKLPFGPYLVVGALLAVFWQQEIIGLYLSLVLPGR